MSANPPVTINLSHYNVAISMTGVLDAALKDLKIVLSDAIKHSDNNTAITIAIVKCLLKSYIDDKTDIANLITTIKNGCPALVNSISHINIDNLKNLNNPANITALTNLIFASLISVATLCSNVRYLKINIKDNTIYEASFLILVALIFVILIESCPEFKVWISVQDNIDMLFNVLDLLEDAYTAITSSTHILSEARRILKDIRKSLFDGSKCSCLPSIKRIEPLTKEDIEQKIALRTDTLHHILDKDK
jgi:hypothetical protein